MGASGVGSLPWSWKECTLLRVCEAYEFCLMIRAPCSEKSAERPFEGGFEGIEKVFAAVGLGGGAQQRPARRGMPRITCLRARVALSRAGVVRHMDRKA
jgi:hypothetical protein